MTQTAKSAAETTLHKALGHALNNGCIIPCRLDPDAWHPEEALTATQARTAIAWCQTCPILTECRAWADTTQPVWSQVLGGKWWVEGHKKKDYPMRTRRCETCGELFQMARRHCRSCRRKATRDFSPKPVEPAVAALREHMGDDDLVCPAASG